MRSLYSLLMYIATPFVLFFLAFRGLRDPGYWQHWGERFGFHGVSRETDGVLLHAASVGEINAAAPLVNALAQRHPGLALTVTTFTPTGKARATELFGVGVRQFHAPLDLPGSVSRLYRTHRPRLLIVMETEIWPNLYAGAAGRNIPVLLANARMSEESVRGYLKLKPLVGPALKQVRAILAQAETDASRYILCGADPATVAVTGNLKFEARLPSSLSETGESLKLQWGASRPVLVAGSTHDADEAAVLSAFKKVLVRFQDALLILAPRHPERFSVCAESARKAGLEVELRSQAGRPDENIHCLVIDTMGELLRYYAACDLAFVGGSIARTGGHNVLEPAALGKPVLVGPHTFNFEEITNQLIKHGAAQRVHDADQLAEDVLELLGDAERRDRMGQAALALVESGRGALDKTLAVVEELLGKTEGGRREA